MVLLKDFSICKSHCSHKKHHLPLIFHVIVIAPDFPLISVMIPERDINHKQNYKNERIDMRQQYINNFHPNVVRLVMSSPQKKH